MAPLEDSTSTEVAHNMAGVRTDEEHAAFLEANKDGTAVVKYGASWCLHCQEVFPHFLRLSRRFPSFSYAVAQIDYLKKEAQHVEYTPTFTFYHKGKRVDEIFGSNMEQLHDHMWLHASR